MAGGVFALEKMMVVFMVHLASGASVVITWTAIMKSFSNWEFAPTKFREESTGTGIFGINGAEALPVNKIEGGLRPEKTFAVIVSKWGKMDMGPNRGVKIAGDGDTV